MRTRRTLISILIGWSITVSLMAWVAYTSVTNKSFLLSSVIWFAGGSVMAEVVTRTERKHPQFGIWWWGSLMFVGAVASALSFAVGKDRPGFLWAIFALLAWAAWYRRWRKRKKNVFAFAGEKSRMLIAKLVRRQAEEAR
jgi:hypothetical protein